MPCQQSLVGLHVPWLTNGSNPFGSVQQLNFGSKLTKHFNCVSSLLWTVLIDLKFQHFQHFLGTTRLELQMVVSTFLGMAVGLLRAVTSLEFLFVRCLLLLSILKVIYKFFHACVWSCQFTGWGSHFTTSETSQMSNKQGLWRDYVKFWLIYMYQPMATIPFKYSKRVLLSLDAVHFVLLPLFKYFRRRGLYGMFLWLHCIIR